VQKNRKFALKKASAADKQATGGLAKKGKDVPASNDPTPKNQGRASSRREADTEISPLPAPAPLLRQRSPLCFISRK
jgi:hypothetical protein